MARPGHAALGDEDRQVGLGAGIALDQPHGVDVGVGGEPAAIGLGVADRGAEADAAEVGGKRLEAGERQAEQIAAFLAGEGVDLVDDDGLEAFEQQVAVGVAEQQAERFGRGEEDVRRADALARLAVRRGVAAARLDADGEAHLLDRGHQVALDVDRQRLERRDVERVEPFRGALDQVDERRQEPRQRLARAGRGDEQGVVAGARGVEHGELVPPRRPGARGEPIIDDARKGARQMSLFFEARSSAW